VKRDLFVKMILSLLAAIVVGLFPLILGLIVAWAGPTGSSAAGLPASQDRRRRRRVSPGARASYGPFRQKEAVMETLYNKSTNQLTFGFSGGSKTRSLHLRVAGSNKNDIPGVRIAAIYLLFSKPRKSYNSTSIYSL
jgi:hypothetical protein